MIDTLWGVLQASLLVLAIALVWLVIVAIAAASIKTLRNHTQAKQNHEQAKTGAKNAALRLRDTIDRRN